MSLLSKSKTLYLQGQKPVSKSYEYKLKSIIRKKMAHLLDKELPLLSTFFPNSTLLDSVSEKALSRPRSRVQILPGALFLFQTIPTIAKFYQKAVQKMKYWMSRQTAQEGNHIPSHLGS
jgi:hypothetical protein